jgi:thiosulfate/3-mercaptopyruvate sulfurtransferase
VNLRKFAFWFALAVPLAACQPEQPAAKPEATFVAPAEPLPADTIFVAADWLADRLGDPELVVLFVGSEADFDDARAPGARRIDPALLNQERDGVAGMLPPARQLEQSFAAVGVSPDVRVVVHGAPLPAARALVALERLGHERVSILDGGSLAWRTFDGEAENGAVAPSATSTAARTRFDHDDELVVDAAWLRDHLDDPGIVIVDARPPAQHRGEEAGEGVPRPGRIPGSVNLFWQELIESGDEPRLRNEGELRGRFEQVGAAPGRTLVIYCRTGMQASFAYAVARHLGYDVRFYDGSFIDWSNRRELPVER